MKKKEIIIRAGFRYKSILEAYAYALTKDWNLAEDAVQEVFIQVSLKWRELDEDRLLSWMKVTSRNKAVDILRKRKRAVYNDDVSQLVDGYFEKYLDEEINSLSWARRHHLQGCMQHLNEVGRNCMLSFYRDGLSTGALGKKFKRSANSVRILMHRSREALRRCINLAIEGES